MAETRYQRRKEERPDEIAEAAFDVFSEHGYAGARVDEVARKAGVSKGLLYLYFKTKEELFKAVVMRVISPRMDALIERLSTSEQSAEEFLRGPLTQFMQQLPRSRARVVIKLMISDGSRHPDLVDFYWESVASKGLALISSIIERGVSSGEFRKTAVSELPQLVIAPMMVATVWKIVFADRSLDTDRLVSTHIDMLVSYLKTERSKTR
ncbi:MAG: TetR/AcrR family transcriptional regulator [Woeseiaceae bacterium]|nr:TetR/AcrR family transcriptional regulator [Woeseiaceae bacterium]